jgi:uncharacterized membrane protein
MVLVWIGHRTHGGLRTVNRFNHRHLAGWLAAPATILLVLAVVVFVGRDVLFRGFVWVANSTYGALDDGTNEGIVRPTSTAASGSPDSLVAWDSLGRWGRNFVAQATTREQLVAFHGTDAALSEPVRVYVGLRTSHDAEEQAALAVRELERTGGFERSVLAVWVPTGAGWMDPDAAMALEELCAGDTAIVATQYSFLPSFFSLIVDVGKATEAGAALFNAVHERWAQLPEADRPQLIVFGLSLGAWGAEAPFVGVDAASSVANFVARADGAVIVGSKQDNPILSQLTADREPGSPVWQPVVDGGRIVRFATRGSELAGLDPAWHRPHIVYLQHPTDAVTYWGVDDFWSPAEWMDVPRGLDVPKVGGWFPIVSGIQGLADLSFQLTLPPGHGHDYRPDYVAAFASVVTPAGWTEADTARLATFLRPPDP